MYLNNTKHKILHEYVFWKKNNRKIGATLDYADFHALFKSKMSEDKFAKSIISLEHDGYINFDTDAQSNKADIEITPKGVSAGLDSHFKKVNYEIVQKLLIDFGMLLCNIIVAIVAVMAISQSNDTAVKDLQVRLKEVEHKYIEVQLKQATIEAGFQMFETKAGLKTNPNGYPKTSDSLKKN
jgi:hypothetical protein